MKILSAGATDRGLKRDQNEDALLIDDGLGLYLVCDGLGGHAGGEVASRETARAIAEHLRAKAPEIDRADEIPGGHFNLLRLMESAVQKACEHIHTLGSTRRECAGMATTITMALVVNDKCILAHVGDCRLYIARKNRVHQLSTDHTLANDMVQSGRLDAAEVAKTRWAHVLTRSVGGQASVQVDTLLFDLFPGDTCLLCSDGLSGYFTDSAEVLEYLDVERIEGIPDELVKFAHSKGAHDNVTAVVFRVDSDSSSEDKSAKEVERQLDVLRSTFLFSGLSLSQLMRVRNDGILRRFAERDTIVAEGNECEGLYVLVRGSAAILRNRERVRELNEGDSFGEASLIRDGVARASVKTLEPSEILVIPRTQFQSIVRRQPRIGRRMQGNLLQRLCGNLDEVASRTGEVRSIPSAAWF